MAQPCSSDTSSPIRDHTTCPKVQTHDGICWLRCRFHIFQALAWKTYNFQKEILKRTYKTRSHQAATEIECKKVQDQKSDQWKVGVIKFFKVPFLQQFSTDLTPKVNDLPRIFSVASIWSCTVASNLKNASSLCSSKVNLIEIFFYKCAIGYKMSWNK